MTPLKTDFLGALTISGFCLKYHMSETARDDLLKTAVALQLVGQTMGFIAGVALTLLTLWFFGMI